MDGNSKGAVHHLKRYLLLKIVDNDLFLSQPLTDEELLEQIVQTAVVTYFLDCAERGAVLQIEEGILLRTKDEPGLPSLEHYPGW